MKITFERYSGKSKRFIVAVFKRTLLIGSIALVVISTYRFYFPPRNTTISHFGDFKTTAPDRSKNFKIDNVANLIGQVKSETGGFLAGEELEIFLKLTLYRDNDYKWAAKLLQNVKGTNIKGSEEISMYSKDMSLYEYDQELVLSGGIDLIGTSSDSGSFTYKGTVVFTRSGKVVIGGPLSYVLERFKIDNSGIDIAPRHVSFVIKSNRLMEMLSWYGIAIALLGLHFGWVSKKS